MTDPNAGVDLESPEEGIAILRFSRPKHLNVLTDDTVAEFGRLLDSVAADPKIRILLLTWAGRAFCAGFVLGSADDAPPNRSCE